MANYFTELPPEIAATYEELAKRQEITDALMSKNLRRNTGGTEYTPGRYGRAVQYSPLQGLTQLMEAYVLKKKQKSLDEEKKKLAQDYEKGYQEEYTDVMDTARGREEVTDPNYNYSPEVSSAYNMGTGPTVPGFKPDPQAAAMQAVGSADPRMQRVGEAMMDQQTNRRGEYARPVEIGIMMPNGDIRTVPGFADTRNATYLDSTGKPFPPGTQIVSAKDPVATAQREFGGGYGSGMGGAAAQGANVYPGYIPQAARPPMGAPQGLPPRSPAGIPPAPPQATPVPQAAPQAIPSAAQLAADKTKAEALAGREAEKIIEKPKIEKDIETQEVKFDLLDQSIDTAIEQAKGFTTTGFLGQLTGSIGGTPAHDLQSTLETIKSNIGFDRLQEMRANSPTGGALGQVSEMENKLLQAVWGALNQSQSEEQFVKNLENVRRQTKESWKRINAAYEKDYGKPYREDKEAEQKPTRIKFDAQGNPIP